MADWGPVVIAVVLFVLLSPGLLIQFPGRNRVVEFGNMHTSGLSILVHTVIFFGLITILLIAIGVHIYTGWWCSYILPRFVTFFFLLVIFFFFFFILCVCLVSIWWLSCCFQISEMLQRGQVCHHGSIWYIWWLVIMLSVMPVAMTDSTPHKKGY